MVHLLTGGISGNSKYMGRQSDPTIDEYNGERDYDPSDREMNVQAEEVPLQEHSIEQLMELLNHANKQVAEAINYRETVANVLDVKLDEIGTSFQNAQGFYGELIHRVTMLKEKSKGIL